ncbi:hypothetical protein [Mycoplasma sp. P36-A1]|uniref:hypothetical protein n=1 Tax=Mycoplasma sp. P36-A1 TaxID=3252900 RepID=UPI003C2B2961
MSKVYVAVINAKTGELVEADLIQCFLRRKENASTRTHLKKGYNMISNKESKGATLPVGFIELDEINNMPSYLEEFLKENENYDDYAMEMEKEEFEELINIPDLSETEGYLYMYISTIQGNPIKKIPLSELKNSNKYKATYEEFYRSILYIFPNNEIKYKNQFGYTGACVVLTANETDFIENNLINQFKIEEEKLEDYIYKISSEDLQYLMENN